MSARRFSTEVWPIWTAHCKPQYECDISAVQRECSRHLYSCARDDRTSEYSAADNTLKDNSAVWSRAHRRCSHRCPKASLRLRWSAWLLSSPGWIQQPASVAACGG